MATTSRRSALPTPATLRQADLLVLALVVAALLLGWLLRGQAGGASQTMTLNGLALALPAGAVATSDDVRQAVTTPDGLTVAVARLPAPPIGIGELQPLAANRALQQSQASTLYRVISTAFEPAPPERPTAAISEYAYVQADSNPLAPSGLTVIRGREALFVRDNEVFVVSVEGAEAQWADVEELWPQVYASASGPSS